MEYATFKKWLAERGCRFDTQREERGEGHGTVTIHREGRTAELLLVGARHELDPRSVRRVCFAASDSSRSVWVDKARCDASAQKLLVLGPVGVGRGSAHFAHHIARREIHWRPA